MKTAKKHISYKSILINYLETKDKAYLEEYPEFEDFTKYLKPTEIKAQVRKSVDSPPDMLTEDHHHTVHEERQVCYSSHLRPKSLHL